MTNSVVYLASLSMHIYLPRSFGSVAFGLFGRKDIDECSNMRRIICTLYARKLSFSHIGG